MPDSIDYRSDGLVSPVKDQGSCGSCWSFSANGVLEGSILLKGGNDTLSEQQLVDCTSHPKGENFGCDGGVVQWAFEYILGYMSPQLTLARSSDYRSYTASQGSCDTREGTYGIDPKTYYEGVVNSDDAHKYALNF